MTCDTEINLLDALRASSLTPIVIDENTVFPGTKSAGSMYKYVPAGVVGTYAEAANASHFEPAVARTTYSAGGINAKFHSRNQGNYR